MRKDLSENILPDFKDIFDEIMSFEYYRLVLKGGRSSGKSVFIAMCIVLGTLMFRRSAIAIIRYKTDVSKRLDNVIIKALNLLGLRQYFRYVQTKHEFILLDRNGQDTDYSIVCTGADDPETLKGIQPKEGSYWMLWIEEASNFASINALKNIESTVGRGDMLRFVSVITYNPRQEYSNFLNKEYENITDNVVEYSEDNEVHSSRCVSSIEIEDIEFKQCVHHCTYKHLIKYGHMDWISPTDLVDIKLGEQSNSEYYRWYYLGEVIGNSSVNVFRNIVDWDGNISDMNIPIKDRGLDVSNGGKDPWAYTETYYDKKNKNLYILAESIHSGADSIKDVADGIRKINKLNLEFYIDSAVPTFKKLLINEGVNPISVKKRPDSVKAGITWLQSLQGIYICKQLTPRSYKEFSEYQYEIDKYDEVTNKLPDADNHTIDSVRYGNVNNIKFE